ncbi:MAG: response regulator [Candidatus Omnitrophica bacterium]|nr:response regulator [Candidatus Omnitrophota bacterium]
MGNTAKKILVVDDEINILTMVEARLRGNGYDVITAMDGQEGLAKARSENPDLIILDIMLPKIDGYKVCRMLKFDEQYKHIPIILFSARTQDSDLEIGEQQGADAYITKPFEQEVLLAKIVELLSLSKS